MGKLSDHLKNFHEHAAAHHGELAKAYHELSSLSKAAKSKMSDEEIAADKVTQCLGKIAAQHDGAHAFHKSAMEACSKVAEGDFTKAATPELEKRLAALENTVMPTRISVVVPTAPGITAVPRVGQRSIPDRPNVPVAFEKLVAIEE